MYDDQLFCIENLFLHLANVSWQNSTTEQKLLDLVERSEWWWYNRNITARFFEKGHFIRSGIDLLIKFINLNSCLRLF